MKETFITFFGKKVKVNCDGNCQKAWGTNGRPRDDNDDYIPDAQLGNAPVDPGTYECGQGKPISSEFFPNNWCVRECERCNMSKPGECDKELEVKRF